MKSHFKLSCILVACFLLLTTACKKNDVENWDALKSLYETYKNGEIYECQYNGLTVYKAGLNAYDAGYNIYDIDGNPLGTCNYAWGGVDAMCDNLNNCEVIYRCHDHINGQGYVDKYGLD